MKKLMLFLLALVPAAVCAQQDQPQPATATICFYRAHRFEGAALKPPLVVDEVEIAHLHNGDAVQVTVAPGPHQVHSNDKSTGIQLDAKAGQTYFVRVDIKTGAWKNPISILGSANTQSHYLVGQMSMSRWRSQRTSQVAYAFGFRKRGPLCQLPCFRALKTRRKISLHFCSLINLNGTSCLSPRPLADDRPTVLRNPIKNLLGI